METVYYYKGNIYLLNSKGELVRFSADGSQRESVAQVYEYGQGDTGTNLVFHDNAVYVYNINEHLGSSETYTETITRYLLDGKEKAVVVQYTGTSSAIMQAKCFGNQLTFLVSEVQKQTADGKILLSQEYKGLYVYRTDTGVAGKVIDEPVSGYCVDEKNSILYYFVKGKGLYSYDCNTKERKMLLEAEADNQMPELSFDGTYIYMDNSTWVSLAKRSGQEFEKKCIVLDKEGNVVNTIPCDRVSRIYFGDSQYIFANISQMISDDIKSSYGYINKSDITSASEWTPMY
jgi:VCBS repeat-containing protein